MSNNKQSSVDWLINQIAEDQMIKAKSLNEWTKIFEQAKAMHKEEIINATIYGDRFEGCYGLDSDQYYEKTFGGNNEP